MSIMQSTDVMWWITAVELPALAGLFWLIWHQRQRTEDNLDEARQTLNVQMARVREGLAAYKLEVAKSYASIAYMKDVERRLTDHLVRIEAKLDGMTKGGRSRG